MTTNANVKSTIILLLVALSGCAANPAKDRNAKENIDAGTFNDIQGVKAFCIDFNWRPGGPKRFAEPGLWADADPKEHVKWYKSLGANVIQTFAVSRTIEHLRLLYHLVIEKQAVSQEAFAVRPVL